MSAAAQTHAVQKPDTVVRAVAVYEWTGELGKPKASRVVPVSLFINGQLEDAGVYLARPVPFVLDQGTVFDVEKAGIDQGSLELSFARHLQTPDRATVDDGWFAYGPYKAKPAPAPYTGKSGKISQVSVNGVPGGSGPSFNKTPDAPKPVDRSGAAVGGTTVSADKTSDPDSDSARDDPERPTLKKRTPQQTVAARKKAQQASVTSEGSLNDDPDRPNLHRGKPVTGLDDEDLPPLKGIPADMHQMVAVSDAKDRPEHNFTRPWESEAEQAEVRGQMEEMARAQLAQYGDAPVAAAPAAPVIAKGRHPKAAAPAPAAAPVALQDEQLKAYTLSYGGAATYFYTASTDGSGNTTRYVTVIAQREPMGALKAALASVTDSAHLDRTPRLRLVDVVDPEAANRAYFLLDLRGQTTRQFALYRVIGAEADQVFASALPQ